MGDGLMGDKRWAMSDGLKKRRIPASPVYTRGITVPLYLVVPSFSIPPHSYSLALPCAHTYTHTHTHTLSLSLYRRAKVSVELFVHRGWKDWWWKRVEAITKANANANCGPISAAGLGMPCLLMAS